MRFDATRALAIAAIAAMTWGCNQAPQPEIDAANTAIERARGSQAPQYAGNSMREAEQAKTALDAEMTAFRARPLGHVEFPYLFLDAT